MSSPFAGDPSGEMRARRVSRPPDPRFVIGSETRSDLIDLFLQLKCLSAFQAEKLLGRRSVREHLRAMVQAGYVDMLETGRTPPLYTMGRGIELLARVERPRLVMPDPLRVAAANQVCVALGCPDGYRVTAPYGPTAVLTVGETEYWVAAPRLWPNENSWLDALADTVPEEARLIVVAPDEEKAREAAEILVQKAVLVRYTWDSALLEGFALRRHTAYGFVRDEGDTPLQDGSRLR